MSTPVDTLSQYHSTISLSSLNICGTRFLKVGPVVMLLALLNFKLLSLILSDRYHVARHEIQSWAYQSTRRSSWFTTHQAFQAASILQNVEFLSHHYSTPMQIPDRSFATAFSALPKLSRAFCLQFSRTQRSNIHQAQKPGLTIPSVWNNGTGSATKRFKLRVAEPAVGPKKKTERDATRAHNFHTCDLSHFQLLF